MNLALFLFGPPLPPKIVKNVIVKIGHSIETLPPPKEIVNKITNFDNTFCHFLELWKDYDAYCSDV